MSSIGDTEGRRFIRASLHALQSACGGITGGTNLINKGSLFAPKRELNTSAPLGARPGISNTPPAATVPTAPVVAQPPKDDAPTSRPLTQPTAQLPQGAKLVVGPGVKLKGAEIEDCDTLVVEGRVEAVMDSRFIEIADQGSFDGKVNIDVAEIRGRFAGELTARGQIVIHSTGQVSGKIRYGKIVIHEGGQLSGDIKSLAAGDNPITGDAGDIATAPLAAKAA